MSDFNQYEAADTLITMSNYANQNIDYISVFQFFLLVAYKRLQRIAIGLHLLERSLISPRQFDKNGVGLKIHSFASLMESR